VAKASGSNSILNGVLGNLYYFNQATAEPGYSTPYYTEVGVSTFYVRLAAHVPCLRVEVPGKINGKDCEATIDVLASPQFDGIPMP
jgi:hypothetical protein